jgi:hypothetical protein
MNTHLMSMKDAKTGRVEYMDPATAKVYADAQGATFLRQMEEVEFVLGDKGVPLRDPHTNAPIHRSALVAVAQEHYYGQAARLMGAKKYPVGMTDEAGQLVTMDLGIADVHTPATLPNYAGGYRIAESIADLASPVIPVAKQSDVYYTWNVQSDFNRKLGVSGSPGSAVPEVNPSISNATYSAVEYALAGFLPTEVQANADTPLQPFAKLTQVVVDALRLEREYRVSVLLQTSGTWTSSLVQTLAAGTQWDGGASSDPVANLHKAIEQSYMPITGIFMSELVLHDFLRNPAVQKYFTYKDPVKGLPSPADVADTLGLPPINVSTMKYLTGGGVLTYMWGNHVVLTHEPKTMPPTTQMDVASNVTFRWTGGEAPDGTLTGGLLVRTYYDPKRGARGGTQIVVVHNDIEVQTSNLVGGLILNAHI